MLVVVLPFLAQSPSLFIRLTLLHSYSTLLTTREKGVLAGGSVGAGTGAIIGNQIGHRGAGAAIGGAFGALIGGLVRPSVRPRDTPECPITRNRAATLGA